MAFYVFWTEANLSSCFFISRASAGNEFYNVECRFAE